MLISTYPLRIPLSFFILWTIARFSIIKARLSSNSASPMPINLNSNHKNTIKQIKISQKHAHTNAISNARGINLKCQGYKMITSHHFVVLDLMFAIITALTIICSVIL